MEIKDRIRVRMYVVFSVLVLVPFLIAGRMVWLYVTEGSELQEQAQRQGKAIQNIPAMRGSIVDRAGRPLAVNTAQYNVAVDPTVDGFESQAQTFFDRLSRLTGTPVREFRRMVAQRVSPQYVRLVQSVGLDARKKLQSWDMPGLILEPSFDRQYNYDRTAAHVLGYVNADRHGSAGVELAYDRYLHGIPGQRVMRRDRYGYLRASVGGRVKDPEHGQQLVLTIDLMRQAIVEEELGQAIEEVGAAGGTVVAMNPHTGAIQAMASLPSYNPNQPGSGQDGGQRNRAVSDQMEPGSTFKIVTAVAAIEQQIVEPTDSIETGDGWAVFSGRTMKDVQAHGEIPFSEVIAHSSNVGVAKTAVKIEPEIFYQYTRNLGFGEPTGIDLPGEADGVLKKPGQWSGTTQPWMSVGYEVQATPLQILSAYGALANDGRLVRPYVVAERRSTSGNLLWKAKPTVIRQAFRSETARKVIPMFEKVIEIGTGEKAHLEDVAIAGKTGTAHVVQGGEYVEGTRASFVGFFPATDPRVVMMVVLDRPETSPYGGQVAAPVFQRIARRWIRTFPDLSGRLIASSEGESTPQTAVPSVVDVPLKVAKDRLRRVGLRVTVSGSHGSWDAVMTQDPASGTSIEYGSTVRLTTKADPQEGASTVPDVRDLATRQAVAWLAARGISARVEGSGTVHRQIPDPGTAGVKRVVLYCR